eukprot:6459615-Amphidinium_carterae.2
MSINAEKTEAWSVGKGALAPVPRTFNSVPCATTDTLDILGITVPLRSNFGLQGTRMLARKLEAHRRSDVLQSLSISWKVKMRLYQGLVQPLLSYGAWALPPMPVANVRTQRHAIIQTIWGHKLAASPRCAEILLHGLLRGRAVDPKYWYYPLWQLLELARRSGHRFT